ncbi:hypothetical protein TanjilG_06587 [Lupinus angustifolius]|uniref:GDSL esterase/lipase n=1 Tax=Lupinus angustifolius TaxID=3871 RepID=A0A394D9J8_LUPAN|nr:hypothetical protein TanjilG_06587 [Lupinus angustifolius]
MVGDSAQLFIVLIDGQGAHISLGLQLENHRVIVTQIASKLGGLKKAKEYLSKCLYYVNIGSNDYLNNYFLPEYYPTSTIYTPEQYAEALIDELILNLQVLHQIGARKFSLNGLGLVGCIPQAITLRGKNGSSTCVEEDNKAVLLFDDKLRSLVDKLNKEFIDSKFVFVDQAMIKSENYPMLKEIYKLNIKFDQCDYGFHFRYEGYDKSVLRS